MIGPFVARDVRPPFLDLSFLLCSYAIGGIIDCDDDVDYDNDDDDDDGVDDDEDDDQILFPFSALPSEKQGQSEGSRCVLNGLKKRKKEKKKKKKEGKKKKKKKRSREEEK